MKRLKRPVRTTILFGLICGFAFGPLCFAMNYLFSWSNAICLSFWMYVAGYATLLSYWNKQRLQSIAFPLLFLLLTIFLMDSIVGFYILALIMVSWIRSGIYIQKAGWMRFAIELLLCSLGGFLVISFTPGSIFAWSLGVWMFFLIQSFYFVIFEIGGTVTEDYCMTGLFERAQKRAETILSAGPH
jgi:hypothetical protein